MSKRILLRILGCICITLIAVRVIYGYWFVFKPGRELRHYLTGVEQTDTWSDEYTHNGVWTAIDGTAYSFQRCKVEKLDESRYNPECACYQWEYHSGESWYTISICLPEKTAYTQIYFHSILDILSEWSSNGN